MAIEAARLQIRVETDARAALSTLRSVEKQAKGTAGALDGLGKSGGGLSGAVGGASDLLMMLPGIGMAAGAAGKALSMLSAPVLDVVSRGFAYRAMWEQAEIGFETMLGSADAARKQLGDLATFAEKTPFEFPDTLTGARRLMALGFAAKDVIPMLTAVGDATAALGGGTDMLDRVTMALGQMRTKGKVSAEEMMQLAEAGIPAWELLAKAIGKTTRETMKLSEAGRLDGAAASQLIAIQLEKRYAGLMARQSKTLQGRQSSLNDIYNRAAGTAIEPLYNTVNNAAGVALQKLEGGGADKLANGVAGILSKITSPIDAAIKGIGEADLTKLGMGYVEGVIKGIDAGKEALTGAGTTISNTVTSAVDSAWQINSPSKVAQEQGAWYVEGLEVGMVARAREGFPIFEQALSQALNDATGRALGGGSRRRPSQREINRQRLEQIINSEPGFLDALRRGSASRGINPDDFLNLMAVESSFSKTVLNKWGYLGLGQVGRAERGKLGLPVGDREAQQLFASRSNTWQLESVLFPFFDMKQREHRAQQGRGARLDTLSEIYAAWGSGHALGDPNALHSESGGKRANMYKNNPTWDVNRDGQIREGEFATAARRALGAGELFTVNAPLPVRVVGGADLTGGVGVFAPEGFRDTPAGSGLDGAPVTRPRRVDNTAAPLTDAAKAAAEITVELPKANASMKEFTDEALRASVAMTGLGDTSQAAASDVAEFMSREAELAKQVIVESEEASRRLRVQWDDVASGFESVFVDSFSRAMDEGENFFSNMVIGFARMVAQLQMQAMAAQLSKLLFNFDGSQGSAGGGFLSKLLGWGISALGAGFGGGGAKPSGSSGGGGSMFDFFNVAKPGFSFTPGRATGGRVWSGQTYWVGEEGRELFTPDRNGQITANDQLNGAQGGRGMVVNNHFHVTAQGGQLHPESQRQMAAKAAASLQHAARRT